MKATRARLASLPREKREYLLDDLPRLLAQAGETDPLRDILTDFEFLRAKLEVSGPDGLVEDYARANDPVLNPIGESLRKASHILASHPSHLPGQLTARLDEASSPGVKTLLDEALAVNEYPWLCSLRPTFQGGNTALVRTLVGHTSTVLRLVISEDGRYALSGSLDGTLRMWDLERWEQVHTTRPPMDRSDPMKDARFSRAEYQIGGLRDPEALERGALGPVAMAASADLRYVIIAVLTGRSALVWDLQLNRLAARLVGHESVIFTGAITRDGSRAATAGLDGTIRIWDLNAIPQPPRKKIHRPGKVGNELDLFPAQVLVGHTDMVNSVAIVQEDRLVLSASQDKSLRLWELDSGRLLHTFRIGKPLLSMAVSGDGRVATLIPKDSSPEVWELDTNISWWDRLRKKNRRHILTGTTGQAVAIAMDRQGERAISAGVDDTLRVWDLVSGTCLYTLAENLGDQVQALGTTPDWQVALTGSADQTIQVWNLQTTQQDRERVARFPHQGDVRAMASSDDRSLLVSGALDGSIKQWDITSGQETATLAGHTASITALAVTPDGERAISGAQDGEIKLWDLETSAELVNFHEHQGRINALGMTGDGRFAVSCSRDASLRVWDVGHGRLMRAYTDLNENPGALALDSEGEHVLIALANGELWRWNLNIVKNYDHPPSIADLLTEQLTAQFENRPVRTRSKPKQPMKTLLAKDAGRINALVMSPDGCLAVSGGMDGRLAVWDLEQQKISNTLRVRGPAIWGLALATHPYLTLLSASSDCLDLWNLEEGRLTASYFGDSDFLTCALSADGSWLSAGDRAGRVHFFRVAGAPQDASQDLQKTT